MTRWTRRAMALLIVTLAASASAQRLARDIEPPPPPPTTESPEDAFRRSLSQNISKQGGDPRLIVAFGAGCAGLITAAIVLNRWRTRPGQPAGAKALLHHGKLLKEIGKSVNIRPAEMRQLKLLAEAQEVQSPLVLLLCPSMLSKAVKDPPRRLDRGVLAALARKIAR